MTTRRRDLFINVQIGWMLLAVISLALLDAFTAGRFFVLSLIGFLVVGETITPFVRPEWWRQLRWVLRLGLLVFGYIVAKKIPQIPFQLWGGP